MERFVDDLRNERLSQGRPVQHFVLLLQEVHRADERLPETKGSSDIAGRIVESPPRGERMDIVTVARILDLMLCYVPSMRNGADHPDSVPEDRGNAILSTLSPSRNGVSPGSRTFTFWSICRTITPMCLSLIFTPWSL